MWAWGSNSQGRLGDGTAIYKSSPIQIPGTQRSDVSAGTFHSFARKTDGTLWAWGSNDGGQLGNNTLIYSSSPIQIPGTQWNDITGGYQSGLARKA